MKNTLFTKVLAAFSLLGAIAYNLWPYLFPSHPHPLDDFYSRFFTLTGVLILALGVFWPQFKAFSRSLPLVARLLLAGFLALMIFLAVKAKGFNASLLGLWGALVWVELIVRH